VYYAIKMMNKKDLQKKKVGRDKTAYDCVLDELNVMQRLEHTNIIWLHEIIDDPSKASIYLVTEYHSKGSLGDQLNDLNRDMDKKIPSIGIMTSNVRLYSIDICKALYYCHNVIQVIHRDIKPDNIMINDQNKAVLIDFGVSALVD